MFTNLQVTKPTEYLITYPTTLTILEYRIILDDLTIFMLFYG